MLPALMLVLAAVLALAHAAVLQVAVQDAAAVGARAAARGDSDATVRRDAQRAAPQHATVAVTRAGGLVRVTVSTQADAGGPASRLLPAFAVSAQAVAADEQATAPAP